METICQGVKIGIKDCPICGNDGRVKVLEKSIFQNVIRQHGSAVMQIECRECGLTLADYTYKTKIVNYAKAAIHIVQRWNRLPRRACHE